MTVITVVISVFHFSPSSIHQRDLFTLPPPSFPINDTAIDPLPVDFYLFQYSMMSMYECAGCSVSIFGVLALDNLILCKLIHLSFFIVLFVCMFVVAA